MLPAFQARNSFANLHRKRFNSSLSSRHGVAEKSHALDEKKYGLEYDLDIFMIVASTILILVQWKIKA